MLLATSGRKSTHRVHFAICFALFWKYLLDTIYILYIHVRKILFNPDLPEVSSWLRRKHNNTEIIRTVDRHTVCLRLKIWLWIFSCFYNIIKGHEHVDNLWLAVVIIALHSLMAFVTSMYSVILIAWHYEVNNCYKHFIWKLSSFKGSWMYGESRIENVCHNTIFLNDGEV